MKIKINFRHGFIAIIIILIGSIVTQAGAVQAQGLSFPAQMNKSFSPISIPAGGISTLSVTVYNPNSFDLILSNAPPAWVDSLPANLSFASPASPTTSCGGTVSVVGTTLSLIGGTVPAQDGLIPGSCTVTVKVTSTVSGNRVNNIPANSLKATDPTGTIAVTNTTPASATLQVNSVQPPSLSKTIAPNTIWTGQNSVLTIMIKNNDASYSLSEVSLTDNLPANIVIGTPVNPAGWSTNCGGLVTLTGPGGLALAAGDASLTINHASINPGLTCSIKVNITSTVPGVYLNTIPANAITSQQGVTNSSAASAPLNVQNIGITKSFSPTSFQAGGTSTLTINLQNPSGSPYTGVSFTDTFPAGMTVFSAPATPQCGGSITSTANSISLSGGTIPTAGCSITLMVTASIAATYTNSIPAYSLVTDQHVTNVIAATANVTVYGAGLGLTVGKSFNLTTIAVGSTSTLTINITAPPDINLTGVSLTDALPVGLRVANPPSLSKTASCGAAAIFNPQAGDTLLSFSNGSITKSTLCTLTVKVTGNAPGVYNNIISSANISNDQNRNIPSNVSATLTLSGLTVAKAFYPPTVNPTGTSTLTITLTNTNPSQLDNVVLTDTLPITDASNGIFVAAGPVVSTTCGSAGIITANSGSQTISMNGGTIPAQVAGVPGICTINVDVVGQGTAKLYTNTIYTGTVSGTIHGTSTVITNPADATAQIRIAAITIGVVKAFNPLTVFGGSSSTLTVQLSNPNNIALTGITFTDALPQGTGGGMSVANPPNPSVGSCSGSITAVPGGTSFLFKNGSLLANASCTLNLDVTMNVNANLTNNIPINAITTANGAKNSQAASATLTNLPGASVTKYFYPGQIDAGSGNSSTLTITIQNTSNFQLDGMGLVDNLPAGITVAAPPDTPQCGGDISSTANSITLSNGVLAGLSSCPITVLVTAPAAGSYQNCIPKYTLTNNQDAKNQTDACDTLIVNPGLLPPTIAKSFAPNTIAAGATSALTFTITNPAANPVALTGVSFTDNFPDGMTRASVPNVSQCGGTVTSTDTSVTLTGGTVAKSGNCTVTISVTAAAGGSYANTSEDVTSMNGGEGGKANATLTVIAPPSIDKTFIDNPVTIGQPSELDFIITNPNPSGTTLTGVNFTDALPTGMRVASPPSASTPGCTAGTFTPLAGDTTLSFSGGSIPGAGTCTVKVSIIAPNGGSYPNSTSAVSSTNGGTGNRDSDTLVVNGVGLSLVKSTTNTDFKAAGDLITYNYLLTNTGDAILYAPFDVQDDHIGSPLNTPFDCDPATTSLEPGGTVSCTATYTVIAADVTAKSITNHATASAMDAETDGNPVVSNQSSVTVNLAALTLKKSTPTLSYLNPGNTIIYNYTLTNSGSVFLYAPFKVTDDHIGTPPNNDFNCGLAASLPPGGNITCSVNYTVVPGDITNGSVTNIASATAKDAASGSSTVTSNSDSVKVYKVVGPSVSKAFAPNPIAVGETSVLTFTITNTNPITLTGVGLVDNLPADMTVAFAPDPAQCGGSVTSTAGSVTLTGGTIIPNSTCTVTVSVTASSGKTYTNTSNAVTSTNAGNGNTAVNTLTVVAPPSISKSFNPTIINEGSTSILTITLTAPAGNTLPISGVGFVDNLPAGLHVAGNPNTTSCGAPSFAPSAGDTVLTFSNGTIAVGGTCTVTVEVTAPAGVYNNTTNPVTTTNAGNGVKSNTATLTVNLLVDLAVTKTDGKQAVNRGEALTYTIVVSNAGPSDAIAASVFDIIPSSLNNVTWTCAPDAGASCPASGSGNINNAVNIPAGKAITYSVSAVVSSIAATDILNTASVAPAIGVSDADFSNNNTFDTDHLNRLSIAKNASPATYSAVGNVVSYSYIVTNIGTSTFFNPFTVTDDKATVTCDSVASLAPGESFNCTASYTVNQTDLDGGSVTNTAQATGVDADGDTVTSNTVSKTVTASQSPSLLLAKSITAGDQFAQVGGMISYSYDVQNNGNVTLSGPLTITDNKVIVTCPPTTSLAPGAAVTCTAAYTLLQSDLDNGSVTNKATAHAQFGSNPVNSNEATQTAAGQQSSGLTLEKSIAAGDPYTKAGDTISYSYLLMNSGNVTLNGTGAGGVFTVTDDKATVICPPSPTSLPSGATVTCMATYTLTQPDLDAGALTNLATAHAAFKGTPVDSNQATQTATADQKPKLTLKKSITSGNPYDTVGGTIAYSYLLTNEGNVTLDSPYTVTDDKTTVTCPGTPVSLAPAATVTCTSTYTLTQPDLDIGSLTNTATAHSSFKGAAVDSNQDSQIATADQKPKLTLKKSITSGDPYDKVGGLLDYAYLLTNEGNVTLDGPYTVTDDKTTVTCPATPATLAPGASVICTSEYTLLQADLDIGFLRNIATAHASFKGVPVDSNQDTQTATAIQSHGLTIKKSVKDGDPYNLVGDIVDYLYLVKNEGNVTLHGDGPLGEFTVTDDKVTNVICPFPPSSLASGESITCWGQYTVTQPDIDNSEIINHARAHGLFGALPVESNEDTATVYVKPGSITGKVYFDKNLDKLPGLTEPGISNVTIQVYDETGATLIATVKTGADGNYSVADLPPGKYLVVETDPLGYVSTTPNKILVTVVHDAVARADFGDYKISGKSTNSIIGTVFDDANSNGQLDDMEQVIPGVTITLYDQNGKKVSETTTGPNGKYSFTKLPPGIYTVVETNPAGYTSTTLDHVSVVLGSGTKAVVDYGDTDGAAAVVDPAVTKYGTPSSAKVGDTIVFTISVGNNSTAVAQDVKVTDTKPPFLDIISVTISPDKDFPVDTTGNTITIQFGDVAPTNFYTVTVVTKVNKLGHPPGGANNVSLITSTAGDPIYNDSDSSRVVIHSSSHNGGSDGEGEVGDQSVLPLTGFAPGVVTILPPQPADLFNADTGLALTIPSLGINTAIVGIPQNGNTWDVSWLGSQVGYLDGTAFPTWSGNSVLTGHVYDANGQPGPFINLGSLKWGDQVVIHAFGQSYTYEVRSVTVVDPDDSSAFDHKDQPWLTLVTCKQYDAATGLYRLRTIVQAVQVKVTDDPAASGSR